MINNDEKAVRKPKTQKSLRNSKARGHDQNNEKEQIKEKQQKKTIERHKESN
jgi:hypothetical protein